MRKSRLSMFALFLVSIGAFQPMHAQIQKGQDIDGEAANDQSGGSVSMPSATTVAIGAPSNDSNGSNSGQVRVFDWSESSWIQRGSDIDGEGVGDNSGGAVSMPDGNTLAIGALWNDGNGSNSGHVRVYEWNGIEWVQKGSDIDGESAEDTSGWAVSMADANTIAIGAPANDGAEVNTGHVRIYTWDGISWVQKGEDIEGDSQNDRLGTSVSMSDPNTVAVGATAQFDDSTVGYGRVYTWNGTTWIQQGDDIMGELEGEGYGTSICLADPNTVAIGDPLNDGNGNNAGHVQVFDWDGSTWEQKGDDLNGEAAEDQSGWSLSMPSANTIAIGATMNSDNGANSGHVRVYQWDGMDWLQFGTDINGEASEDLSGRSVSMADEISLAIGAPFNDGTANKAGHVRVYSFCTSSESMISATSCLAYSSPSNNYTWVSSGIYTDTIPNVSGCDSIITIDLTILQPTSNTINPTSCDSYTSPSAEHIWTNSGTYMDTIPNMLGCDSVITINLTVNNQTFSSISPIACGSYVSPSADHTWVTSGTYLDTIQNAMGCDSIVTVNLTINTVDISITNDSPSLIANQENASYQWLDCDDELSPINGEISQTYVASGNGNYAVQITVNGCTDTSSCELIIDASVVENSFVSPILVFPNPTQGPLNIDMGAHLTDIRVRIKNILGQEIDRHIVDMAEAIYITLNACPGVYFIVLESREKHGVIRVVKR